MQESIATAEKPRDYAGLLWIFSASILGFSLFCGASAVALSDPTLATPIAIQPAQVVDFAFSNPNSLALLTAEAFSKLIPTSTRTPTHTASPTDTATLTLTQTPTRKPFIFFPTATKRREPDRPVEPPQPTNTPRPPTNTPPPPTNTLPPPPTNTVPPPPTNTLPPPPTNTLPPPPTNTLPPPPPDTPQPTATPSG